MTREDRLQSATDDLPLVAGFAAGVVAFLVGYAFTFLLKSGQVARSFPTSGTPVGDMAGAAPADWQLVGWLFYQMHNVGIEISFTAFERTQSLTFESTIDVWLYLAPVIVLVTAGHTVATLGDVQRPARGVLAGITITTGYVLLAVVFVFLTCWEVAQGGGSIRVGANLLPAVLLAGILYPILFGAIGGAIAGIRDR